MKLLLLTTITLTLTSPKAQSPITPTQDFFTYFHQTQTKSEKFIYKKGINTNQIQQFAPSLDTLISWLFKDKMLEKVDTLILTSEEKQHLIKALQNQSDTSQWNHIQFPNSIEIAQDSVSAILKDKARGWGYIYKNYGRQIYTLGLPIFFRNNQYCLLYYGISCGESCSESHFVLYKKESGVWVKGTTIYEGYS
jgi:hypothetical protein